jgi:plastocyanin domain-containing protein
MPRAILLSLTLIVVVGCTEDAAPAAPAAPATPAEAPAPARVDIEVGDSGYTPSEVRGTAGQELTLVFTRTSTSPCGEELVVPDFDIKKKLPLNTPVEVSFTPKASGRVAFACGMNMMKGAIVVR